MPPPPRGLGQLTEEADVFQLFSEFLFGPAPAPQELVAFSACDIDCSFSLTFWYYGLGPGGWSTPEQSENADEMDEIDFGSSTEAISVDGDVHAGSDSAMVISVDSDDEVIALDWDNGDVIPVPPHNDDVMEIDSDEDDVVAVEPA